LSLSVCRCIALDIIPVAPVAPGFAPGEDGAFRGDDNAGNVIGLEGGVVARGEEILLFEKWFGPGDTTEGAEEYGEEGSFRARTVKGWLVSKNGPIRISLGDGSDSRQSRSEGGARADER
jgi:hypothetical protein